MKKFILFGLILFGALNFAFSQEVTIVKDKVFLDGKEILKYEKVNLAQYSFYSLDTDEELFMLKLLDNGTSSYTEDDYFVLNFLTEKIKIETGDFSHIATYFNPKKAMIKLINWLLKEKVLSTEGEINRDKLEIFHDKYHEEYINIR